MELCWKFRTMLASSQYWKWPFQNYGHFKTDTQNSGNPKLETKSSNLVQHKQRKRGKSHIYTQCIGHNRSLLKIKVV